MEKLNFKFGMFLGALILINVANMVNILINVVAVGGLFWSLNGAIAVLLSFVHVVWIDEVLND